jgi:hypothetical protein
MAFSFYRFRSSFSSNVMDTLVESESSCSDFMSLVQAELLDRVSSMNSNEVPERDVDAENAEKAELSRISF